MVDSQQCAVIYHGITQNVEGCINAATLLLDIRPMHAPPDSSNVPLRARFGRAFARSFFRRGGALWTLMLQSRK